MLKYDKTLKCVLCFVKRNVCVVLDRVPMSARGSLCGPVGFSWFSVPRWTEVKEKLELCRIKITIYVDINLHQFAMAWAEQSYTIVYSGHWPQIGLVQLKWLTFYQKFEKSNIQVLLIKKQACWAGCRRRPFPMQLHQYA